MFATLAITQTLLAAPLIQGGSHQPFYPPSSGLEEVKVEAFRMDAAPVTVGEYRAFVTANPSWARGAPAAIFADEGYLGEWASPTDPGTLNPAQPVTGVSWFAARSYCRAAGGDLPTVYQWEYAADATDTAPAGGRKDEAILSRILAWYGEGPDAELRAVRQDAPNYWGLYDMHALVWEWTVDYNSLLISADVRESGEEENLRFCGAGALSARDVEDYASFMRFALRSSLEAKYTTENLGFRCAYAP